MFGHSAIFWTKSGFGPKSQNLDQHVRFWAKSDLRPKNKICTNMAGFAQYPNLKQNSGCFAQLRITYHAAGAYSSSELTTTQRVLIPAPNLLQPSGLHIPASNQLQPSGCLFPLRINYHPAGAYCSSELTITQRVLIPAPN